MRIVSRDKDYNRKRKILDAAGHSNVYIPRFLEVINISKATMGKIISEFPVYRHTEWIVE